MNRIFRQMAGILIGLSLTGCYSSLILLEGEQYQCACTYARNLQLGIARLDLDGDGTPEEVPCTINCGVPSASMCRAAPGIAPVTEPRGPVPLTACAEVVFADADTPCMEACEQARGPSDCSTMVTSSRYVAPGECVHGGGTEVYVDPFVGFEAVRNGVLDTTASFIRLQVEGLGASAGLPLSGGTISVRGGACTPRRSDCPLAITNIAATLDNRDGGIVLGAGHSSRSARIEMNDATILNLPSTPGMDDFLAEVDNSTAAAPPDSWAMKRDGRDPTPGVTFPLRMNAILLGVEGPDIPSSERVALSLPWDNRSETTMFRETLPSGTVNLRVGGTNKFITITGTMDAVVDLDPDPSSEELRDAQLTLDLRFVFFDGAAFVDAAYHDGDPDFVVVDGSGTVDPLGTPGPLTYEWRVRDHDNPLLGTASGMVVLGYGRRTSVPRLVWDHFFDSVPKRYLCLKVTDVERHTDEQCILVEPKEDPPEEIPGCGDTLVGPTGGAYGRVVRAAGLAEELNTLQVGTLFVPTAHALEKTGQLEKLLTPGNEEKAKLFVLDHIYEEKALPARDLSESLPSRFKAASGRMIDVDPELLATQVQFPDIDCGEEATVHAVDGALSPQHVIEADSP